MDLIEPQKVMEGFAGEPAKMVRDMNIDYRALVDRDLTQRSVEYIVNESKKTSPFFLMTSYINPHHPVVPHPDFKGKSGGGDYPDVLMEIDYNVGQILDAIDNASIRYNTIVLFFSDNGPTRYSKQPDQNGDNGPWSGELGSAWEGGLRTIGMMRWPEKIRENWQVDEMIHVMDLYTTLGKIAGGDIPDDRPIDGLDQTEWLLGEVEHSERDSRLVFFNGNFDCIRWRQFKLHNLVYEKHGSLALPAYTGMSIPQLYNLKSDPKEDFNIIGESGATNVGAYMLTLGGIAYESFREFPNNDYSNITRTK
jgi:arylsulfatase